MSAPSSPARRANDLTAQGRPDAALALTTPLVDLADAGHALIAAHASALKASGRLDEALVYARRAAQRWPDSAVAWHNLAAACGDAWREAEALDAAERALSLGLDAGVTWLVKARALLALGRVESAEAAFDAVLAREPDNVDAATEAAQAAWLRTGDPERACAPLSRALEHGGDAARLVDAQAKVLAAAGRGPEGRRRVIDAARNRPTDVAMALLAVQAAATDGASDQALAFARAAQAAHPGDYQIDIHMALALVVAGQADAALAAARRAAQRRPEAQDAWGWVATAARLAGDPQYQALYDYDAFVRSYRIDAPPSWGSLDAYLGDLAAALDRLHNDRTEPYDQSVRNGTQTFGELSRVQDPAIQAFYRVIDKPIRRYAEEIGPGTDPLRRRMTGDYRLSGSWSVRLRRQGAHSDHFHPEGWLSSAFYVRLPQAVDRGREGWIRFGQSPFPSTPAMPAAHHVKPAPGTLVLFPSYMWHGTEPFEGDETRLTIAFDVVPA